MTHRAGVRGHQKMAYMESLDCVFPYIGVVGVPGNFQNVHSLEARKIKLKCILSTCHARSGDGAGLFLLPILVCRIRLDIQVWSTQEHRPKTYVIVSDLSNRYARQSSEVFGLSTSVTVVGVTADRGGRKTSYIGPE